MRLNNGVCLLVAAVVAAAATLAAASSSQHCAGNVVWDVQYAALANPGTRTSAVTWFRAAGCGVRVAAGGGGVIVECAATVACERPRPAPSRPAPPPPPSRTTVTATETAQIDPGLLARLLDYLAQRAPLPAVQPYVGENQCNCSASEVDVGETVTCTARYSGPRAVQWSVSGVGRVSDNAAPDQYGPLAGYHQVELFTDRPGNMGVLWSDGRMCDEVRVLPRPRPWHENPRTWLTIGAVAGGVIWSLARGSDPADNIPTPGF